MSQLGKPLSASLAITVFVLRTSRKVLLLKFLPCTVILSKCWSSHMENITYNPVTGEMWVSFLSVTVYTLTSYCALNNAEIVDWELWCPVLCFELGSFTHKHTHRHYVPLLTSCSGKNLIAVSVKILYIETFVEVAKTACILTFCCSFNIYGHKDVLLPTSSYRRPQHPRLLPQAMWRLMFFSKAHYTLCCLLLLFI